MKEQLINKLHLKKLSNLALLIVSIIITIVLTIFMKNVYVIPLGIIFIAFFAWNYYSFTSKIKNDNYVIVLAECVNSKITPLTFGISSSKIFVFKPINSDEYPCNNSEPFEIQIALSNYKQYKQKFSPVSIGEKYLFVFSFDSEKNENPKYDNSTLLLYDNYYDYRNTESINSEEHENLENIEK